MTAFLWLAFTSSFYVLKFLFFSGWFVARWATWLLWPAGLLVAGLGALFGLGCRQAHAGWFGWLGNDTRKLEAANRAVHAAAEVVNESARLQADQNVAISEAITALSSERAQLTGHLQHIGEIAQQDSQWAAALTAFSPVLVAVLVLAVGALALWLAYREHAGDAELAEVLVESVTSDESRLALGLFKSSDAPRPQVLLPGGPQKLSSITTPTKRRRRAAVLSHIVQITTEVRDEQAVRAACVRLQLAAPENKTVRLFNATATGLCVQLPGWNYPVVCEAQSGAVKYDNYNGAWGRQEELNRFLQAYAVEKARIEARKKGHRVSEAKLEDGSIKVTVHVGGAA